jgi:hypothetical protein
VPVPGAMAVGDEWVRVGAWGARVVVSTVRCERVRRWLRVSPLPRDPLCPTQATSSRGRGRGWGNIELLFSRWDSSVFAIGNATPHPPFGHLPPEGEGPVGCRFVGCGRVGCLWVSVARPEGDRHIFPRSWAEVGWNLFEWDWGGGRENEPVPGAMADGCGVGSCGGAGCSGGRFDGDLRTTSPLAARPPSPARPAVPNTSDIVAGEGPGVGEHRVVVPDEGTRTVSPSTTRPLIRPSGTLYLSKGVQDSFPPRGRLCWGSNW